MDWKYLNFKHYPQKQGCKTSLYIVHSKSSDAVLGMIKWYGPWRQYCFFPVTDTIWSDECLEDVKIFTRDLNARHKS